MFPSIEAYISCNNFSAAATHEHVTSTLSPTRLQSIGGGRMLGEPAKSSPDTAGSAAPEDMGGLGHVTRGGAPWYTDASAKHHQIPQQASSVITWLGVSTIHLDAGSS
jgi:hypothetical protein